MDSPLSPKPRSAVPSYLANGTSHLHASTTTRNDIETENLKTSIGSSYERPPAYHFDEEGKPTLARTVDGVKSTRKQATNHALQNGSRTTLTEDARDLSDHPHTPPLTASRPASPYTLNPPIDFDGLSWPCIGTRARKESTPEETEQRILKISNAVRDIFEALGEDPNREGLRGTPERYAKAMMFFTKGYEENVRDLVNNAVFHEDHDELVMVKDIEVFSLCEHHMVPFIGKMHIGYIPDRRVIGLSKLARLAEMFGRRLQIQERLTKQVALAIAEVLKPRGVAVVMESSHLCMVMRGVQKTGSSTTTSMQNDIQLYYWKVANAGVRLLVVNRIDTRLIFAPLLLHSLRLSQEYPPHRGLQSYILLVNEKEPLIYHQLLAMDLSKILNPLSEKTPKKNLMSRAPSPLRRPETMPIVYPNTASCSSVLHPDDVQRHSPFTKLGQKLPSFMASGRRQHVPPSLHLSHSNGSSTIYSANSSPIQMPEFPLPPTQTPILAYGAISSLSSARAKAKANGYLPPTHFSHSNLGSVGESSMSHNTLPTYNGLLNSHTPHYSTTAQETPDANQTSACNGLWLGRDAGTGSADESDEETTPRPKGVTLDLELGSAKLAEDQNDVFSNWPFTSTSIARNSLDRRMISYPESPMSMGGIPVSALVASPVPTYGSFIPVEPPHGYRTPPPPLAEVKFNQFSILDALCDYPELLFEMVKYLNVDELVNIYAIHKQAHFTINYRFTHVVKLITNMHAPESAEIFQFNLFRDLCMTDPAGRPHPRILGDIRNVPTFRWLRCILFREQVVSDIIDLLAAKGLRLPRPATKVFKMIWLLMDMPTNELRKGYLHSKSWTERDIWCALLIIMKVEMAFTDPEDGQGEPWAYRMMWAQKSLSTLRDVFAGNAGNNQLTNLQMYVRWKIPSGTFDPGAKDLPLMGVPAKETGMLQYEGWGVGRPVLLMRPDEMFEREAIQRGLDVHARHVDLLLWGFIDEATRLDIPISAGTLPTDKLVTIIDEDADAESVLVKDKEVEEGSSNVADDEEEIDNGREEGESNSDDSGAESIDYKNMVPEFN